MRHPCKPDCPRRSATCRIDCEDWAKYEAARLEKYARRDRERDLDMAISAGARRMGKIRRRI